jgi:hypothetical protein
MGLLTYKPHFAPLIFIALLAGRRWTALTGAAGSAMLLAAASLIAFGWGTWEAFIDNTSFSSELLYEGGLLRAKMPTVSAAALILGAPAILAQTLQAFVAAAAAVVVVWLWRTNAKASLRCAGLCLAVLIATPFAFDYDLVILGLALLWFGLDAYRSGWLSWERELLVLGWLTPLIGPVLALAYIPVAPLILAALLWLVVRRALILRQQEPASVITAQAEAAA